MFWILCGNTWSNSVSWVSGTEVMCMELVRNKVGEQAVGVLLNQNNFQKMDVISLNLWTAMLMITETSVYMFKVIQKNDDGKVMLSWGKEWEKTKIMWMCMGGYIKVSERFMIEWELEWEWEWSGKQFFLMTTPVMKISVY